MNQVKRNLLWIWRAWPAICTVLVICLHLEIVWMLPSHSLIVNKISAAIMQIIGGLLVIISVNQNLGTFKKKSLATIISDWAHECPLFHKNAIVSGGSVAALALTGMAAGLVSRKAAETIDERIALLEEEIKVVKKSIEENAERADRKMEKIKDKLEDKLSSLQVAIDQLTEQIHTATIDGFKQQSFGVALAIYGAIVSIFA